MQEHSAEYVITYAERCQACQQQAKLASCWKGHCFKCCIVEQANCCQQYSKRDAMRKALVQPTTAAVADTSHTAPYAYTHLINTRVVLQMHLQLQQMRLFDGHPQLASNSSWDPPEIKHLQQQSVVTVKVNSRFSISSCYNSSISGTMAHAPFAEWLHRPVNVLHLHNTISTIPSGGETALITVCYDILNM
jgi:hypothetical protein